jgi:colanic acid/amylovoran biosynthesis glycosyltransferase
MNQKNKLAYIIPQYPAISETFIADQVNYFVNLGYVLTIYSFVKPKNAKVLPAANKNIKVVYLNLSYNVFKLLKVILHIVVVKPRLLFNIISYYKNIGLAFRAIFWCEPFIGAGYNLVHCHFGTAATKYCLINRLLEKTPRFITTFYGYDVSHIVREKGVRVYDEVKKFSLLNFVMSQDMKTRLLKLGFSEDKIIINPPGADFSDIKESVKSVDEKDVIKILSVGRFVEKKGFDDLLRALAIVREKTQKPFECLIVGDGPLRQEIFNLVARLKLADVVNITGLQPIKDIYNLFYQSHFFVQPSKTAKDGDME